MDQFKESQSYNDDIYEYSYQDEIHAKAPSSPAKPRAETYTKTLSADPTAFSKKRLVFKFHDEVESHVRSEFVRLAKRWKTDTAFSSSTHEHYFHPAYQRIIGLGKDVLPFIISDLREDDADWFWALQCITGKDPVRKSSWGDFAKARTAWLNWAAKNI